MGDDKPGNTDYDHRMPPYVPIDARHFCYTKQDLHDIDRNEARYPACTERWEKVQQKIKTDMSDAEQLRPETKPRLAALYMATLAEGDEEMCDFNTGAEIIANDVDYNTTTTVVDHQQATHDAVSGEPQTIVVPTVVSNQGFDQTALENYADWITADMPEDRDPGQWAAYED